MRTKVKFGGWLLAFFIMQILFSLWMLSGFPDSLKTLMESDGIIVIAAAISLLTLIVYSVLIITSMMQLIMNSSAFFRMFQLAGIVGFFGNLVVYVLREVLYYSQYNVFLSTSILPWNNNANYYWILVLLALFWTLMWSVFFVKSSRTISYMNGREYIDKAIFFKKSESPEWLVVRMPVQQVVAPGPQPYNPQGPYPPSQPINPQVQFPPPQPISPQEPFLQEEPSSLQEPAPPTELSSPQELNQYPPPPPQGAPFPLENTD